MPEKRKEAQSSKGNDIHDFTSYTPHMQAKRKKKCERFKVSANVNNL